MCGPVVDVVEEVAHRLEDSPVRFIHVEVYEDNDPANGYNRWMQEWGLTTEPWTFVVGADGKIVGPLRGPRVGRTSSTRRCRRWRRAETAC